MWKSVDFVIYGNLKSKGYDKNVTSVAYKRLPDNYSEWSFPRLDKPVILTLFLIPRVGVTATDTARTKKHTNETRNNGRLFICSDFWFCQYRNDSESTVLVKQNIL
jgi:hypothetical protein